MRIVLDLQGAQTESRYRGIGRYSLAFAQAIARNRGQHEVIIALNGLFPETISSISKAFDGLLPPQNIVVWQAPGPLRANTQEHAQNWQIAQLMREAFLASLKPHIIHICSVFEGYVDDAITSIGLVDQHTPVSVSFYDLIPLLNPEQYLAPNPSFKKHYLSQVQILSNAALLLSISDFARSELLANLAIDPKKVINVSTATEPIFFPCPVEPTQANALREKYGIQKPFLLYTGGADERKNLDRLLEAFAGLPPSLQHQYQLVFAGKIHPIRLQQLQQKMTELSLGETQCVFTNYISNQELVCLYNLCSAFIFPSWHEGFGIPPLEAMRCGVPVIASNAASIPEVVGLSEALFDPFDVRQMTCAIERVLTDAPFRARLTAYGLQQAQQFSWDLTATRAITAFEAVYAQQAQSKLDFLAGDVSWQRICEEVQVNTTALLDRLAEQCLKMRKPSPLFLARIARDVSRNAQASLNHFRPHGLSQSISWQLEGPFDSSYSLALVNREFARSLDQLGHYVVLHSSEGPGDFEPDPAFLQANPQLQVFYKRAEGRDGSSDLNAEVVSRFMYPPRVHDMRARVNLLHGYAWEETGFPVAWVEDFNERLQGISVCSKFVKKILIDNGVRVPIAVTGLGVDHWERITASKTSALSTTKSFRFLHVSSCFPRKGVDLLLKAYGQRFSSTDDVTLIIKTFTNPHNEVNTLLLAEQALNPAFPEVVVIEDDMDEAALKALFEQCDVLVAPSRAEGFGLPLAEAMLSRLPVITTGWGGQIDFCNKQTAWLVDYQFELANTHLNLFDSVWAVPDVDDLARTMKVVFSLSPQERAQRSEVARRFLLNEWTWKSAAEKLVQAARQWAVTAPKVPPNIAWISTWNTRCGIATYSQHLLDDFPVPVRIFSAHSTDLVDEDRDLVQRCWNSNGQDDLNTLTHELSLHHIDCIVIQFNYGFFEFDAFSRFLRKQLDLGIKVFITLHSTRDPAHQENKKLHSLAPLLTRCQRILVHSIHDLNRLKALAVIDNVMLFPHGVLDIDGLNPVPIKRRRTPRQFVIASYGFFLPHKGLLELIDAFALLHQRHAHVRLCLVNAQYPIETSAQLIAQAVQKIALLKLSHLIKMQTDFLSDEESLSLLQQADLTVFPYQETGESASGAVRYALAAGKPVAVTPLAIFDDVRACVHELPGMDAAAIARGIGSLMAELKTGTVKTKEIQKAAEDWRRAHLYRHLARRLYGVLCSA
jgi:glycosyltransferase involved in cell wall biosynthesis